jgi:hypothetical protein
MDAALARIFPARERGARVAGALAWVRNWRSLPHAILFCLLLLVNGYTPPRWQDWNQNSRFDLTQALVEQGTVRIDDYADNTGDYATIDGHRYSDKAPGLSLAAVPLYAVVHAARPLGLGALAERLGRSEGFAGTLAPGGAGLNAARVERALALYLITVATVGLMAAWLGVLLALVVERLWGCRTAGLVTALVFGLATPLFPYAQAFYGHVPAAACVFAAYSLLVLRPDTAVTNRRLCAIGALLACAIVIEYPAALVAVPVAVWALAIARGRAALLGALGAVGPLAALVAYDLIAFGTPWPVGYANSTLWQAQHQQGFMSVTYPKWEAALGLLVSPFRGLLFFSPVLLVALAGIWLALRERRQRAATLVALAGFGAIFLFTASSAMWWGGFAVGPRYLVPGLPLLAVPFGAVVAWCNEQATLTRLLGLGTIAAIAGGSLVLVWGTTFARQNYPPDTLRQPLVDYVLPALREGDVARNLGMAFQIQGVASLLPLVVVLALGVAGIGAALRPGQPGSARA